MTPNQQKPRPLPLFLDLVREMALEDATLSAKALQGLALYQQAERQVPARQFDIAAQKGRVRLLDYGGDGPTIIFVPSIINPHFILDLAPGNSLAEFVRAQGYHVLLVDWGYPAPSDRHEDIGVHITDYLVPLVQEVRRVSGPAHLVGYCLGGVMALAAAHLVEVASLSMIASPWHFDHYGDDRAMLSGLWNDNEEACDALGLVPMEILQTAFWRMDPDRTVRKYAKLVGASPEKLAQFVALEDWANDGAPLTYAAGQELFVSLFTDNITGNGRWSVGGKAITPETLLCPARQFVSTTDRIVPVDSCPDAIEAIPSPAGHVGMVVGSTARPTLWSPLAKWLSQVQHKREA